MNKVYWTTRDGKRVDVDEMDCQHLRNTLKMLLRNKQETKKKHFFKLNGEMAQDFVDSQEAALAFRDLEDEYLDEAWDSGEFYKLK